MWAPPVPSDTPSDADPPSEPGDPFASPVSIVQNNVNSATTGTNFASTSLGNTTDTTSGSPQMNPWKTPVVAPFVGNPEQNPELFRTPIAPPPRRRFMTTGSSTTGLTTPRSCTTTTTTTTPSSRTGGIEPLDRSTIVALVEGRGLARGEIGMACMNIHSPNLILCQFNDTQSYMRVIAKINVFRPYEVLMSSTSCEGNNPSQLYKQLSKEISNMKVVPIQRRIFNEAKGLQKLNSLVAENYAPVVHAITNKYYCLAASHALFKYVEVSHSTLFSARTLRIEFQGSDQTCMIDHVTAQHLELLQNNQMPGSNISLLGILNSCKTPHGSRLLRMSILQPSCDVTLINSRLDSIDELNNNRQMLFDLQDILGRLPMDIEHVIGSLVQIPKVDNARVTEQRINNVIALKQILEIVPNLTSLLQNSENDYFQQVRSNLNIPQYESMLESIKRIIQDEAQFQKGSMNMKRQRCFAVKPDINPILDIARQAYCELIDDINKYVIQLSEEEGISFRLGTNNQRGFFIQFFLPNRADEIPSLPAHFLQVRKRGNVVTFTTEALISIDHRAQEILKEVENLSNIIISELIALIRNDIGLLYNVSEAIGNLDLINALANYALITPRCVRPKFLPDSTSIRMGRHPILDSISADPSVPNNTFLSDYANFMLITGPNMSGKTTYIKHVATLQVMAQLGSFVPADAASFRITRNIMSRIGTGDNLEENSSSFALEMTEMTYILQNVADDSLVIIDELGRATSVEEGAAISWAIAEELLSKTAFVLFATHHMLLTKLESHYVNALNFTLETQEWEDGNAAEEGGTRELSSSKLEYTHVIKRGVTDVEYYGLKLAMNTCYPLHIIENAISMSRTIMRERGMQQSSENAHDMNKRRNKVLLTSHLLLAADSLNLGDDDENVSPEMLENVRHYLESLQEEFRTTNGIYQVESPNNPDGHNHTGSVLNDPNNALNSDDQDKSNNMDDGGSS